jgi:hypothetical protein
MRATWDWIVLIAAFALTAASAGMAVPFMANAQGGFGPTVFTAQDPGPAVAALGAVLVVACLVMLSARAFLGPIRAMGAVGAGLGWGALRLDTMRLTVLEASPSPAVVDGIAWTVIVLMLSWLMFGRQGGELTVQPDQEGLHPDPMSSPEALRAAAIGAVAGLVAAWLIARSDLRQQTVIAAVVGGIVCGLVGRLAAPHCQPVLLPPAVVLGGTLAGWLAWFTVPSGLSGALAGGTLPNLLFPLPMDWAVGGLIGVPVGFAMAHGFLRHDDDDGESARA